MPFDFFGLGQPINGPIDQSQHDQEQDVNNQDPWPMKIQANGQQMQEANDLLNLNEEPQQVEEGNLDLNQAPLNLDLDPVIINPIHPQDGDFLEMNDMQNNEEVHYLLQHENEVFQLNPQEQELMEVADELHQQLDINILAAPGSPMYWQVEEVPLDQLIEPGDVDSPVNVENINPPEQLAEENLPQVAVQDSPIDIQAEVFLPQAINPHWQLNNSSQMKMSF